MKKQILIKIAVLLSSNLTLAQTWDRFGGNTLGGGEYLGANGGSNFALELKTIPSLAINFYTNNTQRMSLGASGKLGLGLSFAAGNDMLDILPDVGFPRTGYGINNQTILHNYGIENISLGVGAGQALTSGFQSVFIGDEAGLTNTIGFGNSFIGANSGKNNSTGNYNTFLGFEAGRDNTISNANTYLGNSSGVGSSGTQNTFVGNTTGVVNSGNFNTFMGTNAGLSNTSGGCNVFIGKSAARDNTTARFNTMVGFESGRTNTTGENNTFVGKDAGLNQLTGNLNTFIGVSAGSPAGINTNNSTAVGSNSVVATNDDMILGDNNVNVGIGLSNVAGGPLTKLQLLGTTGAQFRISYDYTNNIHTDFTTTATGNFKINPSNGLVGINLIAANPANTLEIRQGTNGFSGLRFTNLNNGNTAAATNPGQKVLGLNASGDVILVNDVGGGSVSNSCAATNIMARWTSAGTTLDCSDIYNNFTTHRVGVVNATPNYTLDAIGSACFGETNNVVSPGSIHYQHSNTHPVTILSDGTNTGRGLSLLRAYGNTSLNAQQRDNFRMFNDQDGLTHIRTIGASGNPLFNVTFDHLLSIGTATPTSWLGYNSNPSYLNTVIKSDFNTNPVPTNSNGKLCVEAQPSSLNSSRSAITATNVNTTNTGNHLIGIWAESNATRTTAATIRNVGGLFKANNITTGDNVAVNSVVEGAQTSTNNYGLLSQVTATGSANNYGAYVQGEGAATKNYGVYAIGNGTAATTNYGVYAYANLASANNYGIYATASGTGNWAGFFSGPAGNSGGTFTTSDSILKTNVTPLTSAMALLSRLPVKEYDFDLNKYAHLGLPTGKHYGIMAQDYANVFPQLVKNANYPGEYDAQGNMVHSPMIYKMVNREELIPIMVAAMQEQNTRIDALEKKLDECCYAQQRVETPVGNNTSEVELANAQTIYLDQNNPNPFLTETNINYNIPENILAAKIIFYNNNGTVLKEVEIKHTGKGSIKVYAPELSSGIYSYSLIADNKVIDSKKMMKAAK